MLKRRTLFIVFLLICALLMPSCSTAISTSEAKDAANEFFEHISKGEYEEAEAMFHPDITLEYGLEDLFHSIRLYAGVSARNGISAEYTGMQSMLYDSKYGGGYLRLDGVLTIDGQQFDMVIEFIKRDKVFGIYNFNIDVDTNQNIGPEAAVNM